MAAVRARGPDRGARDLLADSRAAAAAGRELAARPHCALLLLRKEVLLSTCNICCWQVLVPVGHEQLRRGPPGPGQLARRARARRRGRIAR